MIEGPASVIFSYKDTGELGCVSVEVSLSRHNLDYGILSLLDTLVKQHVKASMIELPRAEILGATQEELEEWASSIRTRINGDLALAGCGENVVESLALSVPEA